MTAGRNIAFNAGPKGLDDLLAKPRRCNHPNVRLPGKDELLDLDAAAASKAQFE